MRKLRVLRGGIRFLLISIVTGLYAFSLGAQNIQVCGTVVRSKE